MRELDIGRVFEISNRTSELQESEVDPSREIHAFKGFFEKFILLLAEGTVFFDVLLGDFGIAGFFGSFEPFGTGNTCLFDLFFDIDRASCFGRPISEILHLDSRYPDEEIDTIEDGSGEFRTIAFDLRFTARTGFFFISEVSARTRIERTDEDEFRRIGVTRIHPIDSDFAVFEGLSKHFQEMSVKFEEFIKEEDSFVSQANLSRSRIPSSSDDTDRTRRVVHFAKWSCENERMILGKESCNRVDFGGLHDFGEIHIRQDSGECFREHSFPRSGRSFHEDIVSSGRRNHEGSLGMFLPDDMLESRFGRLLSVAFNVFLRIHGDILGQRIGSSEDAHE